MINLKNVIFSITDTETTGKEQGVDEAIEIASVKWNLEQGFLETPKSWFVKPNRKIHPSAMAIHHLTEDDIKDALPLSIVKNEVIDYVKDTTIVAHNAPFDESMLPFLKEWTWLDSLRIARHLWSKGDLNNDGHDLTSHTCQELRYWLNLKVDTMGLAAHRAAADILVAGEVFGAAVKKYLELTENESYEDFVSFCKAPVLVKSLSFSKYKGVPLQDVPTDFFAWYLNKIHSKEMEVKNPDELLSIEIILKSRGIDPLDLIKGNQYTGNKSWNDIADKKSKLNKSF